MLHVHSASPSARRGCAAVAVALRCSCSPVAAAAATARQPAAPRPTRQRACRRLRSSVLRRGNGPEPDTLDPQLARTDAAFNILRDLFEGLTAIGPGRRRRAGRRGVLDRLAGRSRVPFHAAPRPALVERRPAQAADFVAGMRRLVDPKTASPYAQFIDPVLNAAAIARGEKQPDELGVSAPDDRTVVIRLGQPGALPARAAGAAGHVPGARRRRSRRNGTEYARPGKLVSNGAFVLDDWVVGSHVVAAPQPHYWNDAADALERVHYVHIADAGTELRQYRAGSSTSRYVVPPQQFQWIKAEPGGRAARRRRS